MIERYFPRPSVHSISGPGREYISINHIFSIIAAKNRFKSCLNQSEIHVFNRHIELQSGSLVIAVVRKGVLTYQHCDNFVIKCQQ